MGILDKIGLGKEEKKHPEKDEKVNKDSTKEKDPVDLAVDEKKAATSSKKGETLKNAPVAKNVLAHRILIRPILSEKAVMLAGFGEYIFAVDVSANKTEIKKSIEKVYGVNVMEVKTMRVPGKQRRYGRTTGKTSSWKKAIVKLEKGEKIPGIIESVG